MRPDRRKGSRQSLVFADRVLDDQTRNEALDLDKSTSDDGQIQFWDFVNRALQEYRHV
jgi:hypothetical protein